MRTSYAPSLSCGFMEASFVEGSHNIWHNHPVKHPLSSIVSFQAHHSTLLKPSDGDDFVRCDKKSRQFGTMGEVFRNEEISSRRMDLICNPPHIVQVNPHLSEGSKKGPCKQLNLHLFS